MYVYIYIFVNICKYIYVCMYVCIYIYMYIYICVCVYIHIYIYTYMCVYMYICSLLQYVTVCFSDDFRMRPVGSGSFAERDLQDEGDKFAAPFCMCDTHTMSHGIHVNESCNLMYLPCATSRCFSV